MQRIRAILRISAGLVGITIAVLMVADLLGLIPNPKKSSMEGRKVLCENLALRCSIAAGKKDTAAIRTEIQSIISSTPSLLSAAVRKSNNTLIYATDRHETYWNVPEDMQDSVSKVEVPIYEGKRNWGTVELCFKPLVHGGLLGIFYDTTWQLFAFISFSCLVIFLFYLRKVLQHLDPSQVIPDHVRAALDTLSEGILVLDRQNRIVLANRAFSQMTACPNERLLGRQAASLDWVDAQTTGTVEEFPWSQAAREGEHLKGAMLGLQTKDKGLRKLVVNATLIYDGRGKQRGTLATFDDVSEIAEKNVQLASMLEVVDQSRRQIEKQNQELQYLATRDPLTGCFNRRSFFTQYEAIWAEKDKQDGEFCCIMVDVDHFKMVNDNHGHSTGDEVLKQVSHALRTSLREGDVLCRYGGEEFCAVLPHTNIENAVKMAERFRKGVESLYPANLMITISLGVSSSLYEAHLPQELLDQADAALYAAKRTGRNRHVRWDQIPADVKDQADHAEKTPGESKTAVAPLAGQPILYREVSTFLCALSKRNVALVEHACRVADLCVSLAKDRMSPQACYTLEVAALLHDVSKIGMPEEIIYKQGLLTEADWKVVMEHETLASDIIAAAFGSEDLTEIVRSRHAWFAGNPNFPDLPKGEDIPLGARVLALADAFDTLVTSRPHQKAVSRDEAFEAIRRASGVQFDPALVEPFIQAVMARDSVRHDDYIPLPIPTVAAFPLEMVASIPVIC